MESRQRRAVERGRIIGMREAGHSISEIARDLGLTRQTVQRWLTRWEESGNLEDRQRSGRPKMTSAEDTAGIRAAVERNPFTNSVSVREQLEKIIFMQDNCPVHKARVVQRWFEERMEQIELLPWPALSPDLRKFY
ncbi:hypothetical protein Pmani_027714 [Petrolisthes manimaculis]|uniref:Tc1-like transposase DDE domain-containing protein n=1 Tax=Petrolisthes manimaculis TaxID=1843537 RepID=A0AAE1P362_9EUCA|nr:hypothetical protein Pmani_027714 [Petrolisthes manimaculis]